MVRALLLLLAVSTATARAEVPCAAGGPPILAGTEGYAPPKYPPIFASGLVTTFGIPYAGGSPSRLAGDPTDGMGFDLQLARVGVCGVAEHLAYRVLWEPWSADERVRPDAAAWGRFSDFELAWLPYDWLVVAAGIMKVPFSRAREQPEGAMALPLLTASAAAIAPDRRLGADVDADLGVFRLALGAFEASRSPTLENAGGLLVVARAHLEPFGPVGRRAWPDFGEWTSRFRPATGLSGIYRFDDSGKTTFAVAADVSFAWRRVFFSGEVLYADNWPLERPTPTPDARANRLGAWAELLVVVIHPFVSLAARADFFDEDLDHHRRAVTTTFGATLYAFGPGAQLQLAYSRRFAFDDPSSDELLLALTIAR